MYGTKACRRRQAQIFNRSSIHLPAVITAHKLPKLGVTAQNLAAANPTMAQIYLRDVCQVDTLLYEVLTSFRFQAKIYVIAPFGFPPARQTNDYVELYTSWLPIWCLFRVLLSKLCDTSSHAGTDDSDWAELRPLLVSYTLRRHTHSAIRRVQTLVCA